MSMIDLRLGDCLEVMRELPDNSVDLILTDPAYESMKRWEGVGTTARMGMGKKGSGSDDISGKFFDCISDDDLLDFVQECHRVLKHERHCYMMCDFETLKLLHTFAITEGVFKPVGYGGLFEPCKPLIWDTGDSSEEIYKAIRERVINWLIAYSGFVLDNGAEFNSTSYHLDAENLLLEIAEIANNLDCQAVIWDKMMPGMGYTYRTQYEFILMLWKGKKRRLNNLGIPDVLRFKKPWGKERVFPTQKPTELFELLINQSTQVGEIVLDPFLGSGTCAIAAMNTNRKFIGIEKSKDNMSIAQRRIEAAQAQAVMQLEGMR